MTTEATAGRKSYAQICPIATALDIVGDRWTLLILRELLGGPARFGEIEAGLPGIAKNLLSSRLRRLETDGIVDRTSLYGAPLYSLTAQGAAIRPALEAFGFWGASLAPIAPIEHGRSIRAIAMALQSVLIRAGDVLPAQRYLIELEVDGEYAEILLGPRPTVTARPSPEADAHVSAPTATISAMLLREGFDPDRFACVSGHPAARDALLRALAGHPLAN